MRKSAEERFWKKVRKSDGCWEWLAAKNSDGYGQFKVDGRQMLAHRWAYEQLVGPIPPELVCDHLCRNPGCVNPAHIELVTNKENILRGNAPSAQRARQITCKNGHPLVTGPRQRGCPRCHAEQMRTWKAAHREKINAQRRARYAAKRETQTTQAAVVQW